MNFFLTDKNGTKHSLTEQQLQTLAAQGRITPQTPLETDTGHKGLAGQIPGLNFNTAAPSPFTQPVQAAPPLSAIDENKKPFGAKHIVVIVLLFIVIVYVLFSILDSIGVLAN